MLNIKFVKVPSGPFIAGVTEQEKVYVEEKSPEYAEYDLGDDLPMHTVYLEQYAIAAYAVTYAQFRQFVDETNYRSYVPWAWITDDLLNHPVTQIRWRDAEAFCNWAGYRLPTELEWEKAARGIDGRIFPWGNRWNPEVCNTSETSRNIRTVKRTVPVDHFPAGTSPFGLYNMAGNVFEWTDNRNHDERNWPVLRGGGADGGWEMARCAARLTRYSPNTGGDYFGFRCAKDL